MNVNVLSDFDAFILRIYEANRDRFARMYWETNISLCDFRLVLDALAPPDLPRYIPPRQIRGRGCGELSQTYLLQDISRVTPSNTSPDGPEFVQDDYIRDRILRIYHRRIGQLTMGCGFCRNNRETADVYLTHFLHDPFTSVLTCPVLRRYVCKVCGGTGDYAHTLKYCPLNKKNRNVRRQA